MSDVHTDHPPPDRRDQARSPFIWPGLGHWNLYFLAKLLLFAGNYIRLDLRWNFTLIAFLVVPLRWRWLNRVRHLVAIPAAVALLYHESWFPPITRLLDSPELLDFSPVYLLELVSRLVSWEWLGAAFVTVVAYYYLSQWLRFTAINLTAFIALGLVTWVGGPLTQWWAYANPTPEPRPLPPEYTIVAQEQGLAAPQPAPIPTQQRTADDPAWLLPTASTPSQMPDDTLLNDTLAAFHQAEATRRVSFTTPADSEPFDILMLSVCSLSWSDLDEVALRDHPFLTGMDIVLEDFNSATSYSGPAVLRLLRAKCGQPTHSNLYEEGDPNCNLMQSLQELGFDTAAALNHDGQFQGFLEELRTEGNLPEPYIPTEMRPTLTAFDGAPIWSDYDTLANWWQQRESSNAERRALLYNTITLHDGNREATQDGGGRSAPFAGRAATLLDDLLRFEDLLAQSGRRVLLVLVPEHGAALQGDRMQFAGLREVPTPSITRVPVGLKLIGAKAPAPTSPIRVNEPTSYLALSELMARILEGNLFEAPSIDWSALAADLPLTAAVSENEGSVFLEYGNTPFVRMGERNWVRYPQ